jgi:hypothetical protein
MESHPANDNDSDLLKKWNWGAFMLGPIWAFTNGLDLWAVLCFVPGVNIAVLIYLGVRGNMLAFEKSQINSEKEFMILQDVWGKWGLRVLWISLIFGAIGVLLAVIR